MVRSLVAPVCMPNILTSSCSQIHCGDECLWLHIESPHFAVLTNQYLNCHKSFLICQCLSASTGRYGARSNRHKRTLVCHFVLSAFLDAFMQLKQSTDRIINVLVYWFKVHSRVRCDALRGILCQSLLFDSSISNSSQFPVHFATVWKPKCQSDVIGWNCFLI